MELRWTAETLGSELDRDQDYDRIGNGNGNVSLGAWWKGKAAGTPPNLTSWLVATEVFP